MDSSQTLVTQYLSVVFGKKSGQPEVFRTDPFVDVNTTPSIHFPPSHISGRLIDLIAPSVPRA